MKTCAGLALLIVVGVLGILAVLAAAFVTMAQLERRASLQRLDATKAGLLARSGLEDAMARLGAGQDADLQETRYLGEDWNADGFLNGPEPDEEVYRPGTLDVEGCPVRQALRPSFFARDSVSANQPQLLRVDGCRRGYTGRLAGDRAAEGNHYAVKLLPQAGIWVNGGDPAAAPTAGYNAVLRRILGNLAEALDRENGGANDGTPVDLVDGWNLIDPRPQPGGWTSWEQVRDVAFAGSPPVQRQAKLDALKPYLTLHAWVDTRTLKPDATTAMQDVDVHTWSEIKQGVNASYTPTRGMPVLDPRAPVNLAWARRRWPVLVALMGGLKNLYLEEAYARNANHDLLGIMDYVGRMSPAELVLDWNLSEDPCRKVASRLAGYANPIATWDDWDTFCNTLTIDLDYDIYPHVPAMRSLLKANFNPNSRLNKFNPNRAMWNMVDKQDLLVHATEFVLEPVHAHEVESVGRMLGKNGRLGALRALRCEIPGPKVARLSTQREFVCSDLGSLEKSGDETVVRIPGVDTPFLPMSQGPGIKTWGQDLPGLGGNGVGVQSYPEPYVDPTGTGSGLILSPADYDGSLQLATLETVANDTYTVTATTADMKMLARWTADLDLAVSDAFVLTGDPEKRKNQPDSQQAPLGNGLLDPGRPNTLHPDGCYSERSRAPGYFDKGNADGLNGLMSFWMKPSYHAGSYLNEDESLTPSNPGLLRTRQLIKWTNFFSGEGGGVGDGLSPDQSFALVHGKARQEDYSGDPFLPSFTCFFETSHATNDDLKEHQFQNPGRNTRPHRWTLLTFAWDLQALVLNDRGEMVIDGGTATSDVSSNDVYDPTGSESMMTSDFTADDLFGPHLVYLGRRGFLAELAPPEYGTGMDSCVGLGADATFDEFAIYDLGAGVGAVGGPAATLALHRFREGRYYKESAYEGLTASALSNTAARWFSAPIDLGGGRLRALSWTQVLPRGLRAPLPAGGKPGVDGDNATDDDGDGEGIGDGLIEMEISSVAGDDYALDTSGQPINATFRNSASIRVDRTPSGPFRLHAVFRPNLADKGNTPVLDPLSLDDVTLLYDPPGGSGIRSWGEGAP